MARKHAPYAREFRRQMIELVRAGRTPEELAKEFEPSAQAIRNWVAQADPTVAVGRSHHRNRYRLGTGAPHFNRSDLRGLRFDALIVARYLLFCERPKAGSERVDRHSRRHSGRRHCCRLLDAAVVGLHRWHRSWAVCIHAERTGSARPPPRCRRIREGCSVSMRAWPAFFTRPETIAFPHLS
jgi:hypothetical protein